MSGKISDNLGRSSGLVKAAAGGGKIGQVLTTQNTAVESTTSSSFSTIPDFSRAITPVATSSKILVVSSLQLSHAPQHTMHKLMRDSTPIGIGDTSSARDRVSFSTFEGGTQEGMACWSHHFSWLDSPSSTSEIIYSWSWRITGVTLYMNRAEDFSDHANYPVCASSITCMEVLA